jgi:hypothetical protein
MALVTVTRHHTRTNSQAHYIDSELRSDWFSLKVSSEERHLSVADVLWPIFLHGHGYYLYMRVTKSVIDICRQCETIYCFET